MTSEERTKILLVEDEAIIALSEAKLLTDAGYEVETVHSGEKGVEAVEKNRFDLILMDIDLGTGRMDGTEAAEIILHKQDLPIVFLTSHAEKEYVDRVKGITGSGYILKNSGRFVLLESISMALTLFEAKKEAENHLERLSRALKDLENREYRMEHMNRVLRTVRNINQLITKETDEKSLLEKACRMMIETSGYRETSIVLDSAGPDQRQVYGMYRGDTAEVLTKYIQEGCVPRCAREAIKSGTTIITVDPDTECRDCALLPLQGRNETRDAAVMTAGITCGNKQYGWVSAVLPDFYVSNPEERSMFSEIAGDIAYALYSFDVHEQKRSAELRTRESEEKYRRIFENTSVGIIQVDRRYILREANEAFLEMTGYTAEELIGKSIIDITHPDNREPTLDNMNRIEAGKTESFRMEKMYVRKDGSLAHALLTVDIIRDEEGNPKFFIGTTVERGR